MNLQKNLNNGINSCRNYCGFRIQILFLVLTSSLIAYNEWSISGYKCGNYQRTLVNKCKNNFLKKKIKSSSYIISDS